MFEKTVSKYMVSFEKVRSPVLGSKLKSLLHEVKAIKLPMSRKINV
jgi:hypothetical protein